MSASVWCAVSVRRTPERFAGTAGKKAGLTNQPAVPQSLGEPVGHRGDPRADEPDRATPTRAHQGQPGGSGGPVEGADPREQELLPGGDLRGAVQLRRGDDRTQHGGCTGPEKISGPPTVIDQAPDSASGKVIAPPAAANDLFSDSATTVRASVAGARCSRAYPRPCRPVHDAECASST